MHHRHQCWFYASMDRFLVETPQAHQHSNAPHPALTNAIYLLSCHFSQTQYYMELEPAFLTQAQREINLALDSSDRLPDIVQASSLLAIYFYIKDRVMEGYRHTFCAVRLALAIGLHHICADSAFIHGHHPALLTQIPPPCDNTELDDRIFAFWQAFMVDRCWSVANGLPGALPSKGNAQFDILTPWPSNVKWGVSAK